MERGSLKAPCGDPPTRRHRGYRIVAQQLGGAWTGIIYAPGSNAIVETIEGASAQELMVRGVGLIDKLLAKKA